jgi:hypothetical protein
VEYIDKGRRTVYATADAKPDGAGLTMREMDCMDCHNRPSHTFEIPDRAVDREMNDGLISASLPFAKKKAVELLKASYASREDAAAKIPGAFAKFYQDSYPQVWAGRRAEVQSSGMHVLEIYNRNIFPDMNVTWGKYPLNIGHTDYPGCFRCHDGSHNAKDGASITQDCNACHNLLSMDEANPPILTELGITQTRSPESR